MDFFSEATSEHFPFDFLQFSLYKFMDKILKFDV